MTQLIQEIGSFLGGIPWRGVFDVMRVLFIVLDVMLLGGFVFSVAKGWKTRVPLEEELNGYEKGEEKKETTEEVKGKEHHFNTAAFKRHWAEVEKKASEGTPQALHLAVIAADNLADEALKEMELPGEHMADRLQHLTEEDFNQLEDLWRAHKLRNELVHTPGFELKKGEAEEVLRVYESFLRTMRALK